MTCVRMIKHCFDWLRHPTVHRSLAEHACAVRGPMTPSGGPTS